VAALQHAAANDQCKNGKQVVQDHRTQNLQPIAGKIAKLVFNIIIDPLVMFSQPELRTAGPAAQINRISPKLYPQLRIASQATQIRAGHPFYPYPNSFLLNLLEK
jgi:hypothetical protein